MSELSTSTSSYKINGQYTYSILALICFLISPLLSLPFILIGIYNQERFSLFILSMFFGILSYYLIPSWELDISRYYFMYQEIASSSFTDFKSIIEEQNDYVFFFIYYFFSQIGFSFQYFLLLASTFIFFSCIKVADLVIRKNSSVRLYYFILMMSFVLSLPILAMISVTRFSIGFSFFMLFIYHHLKESKKISYIYLALCCFTHFAFIIYIPFIVAFYFFKNRKKINSILLGIGLMVIFFSVTGELMNVLQLIPFLAIKAQTYLTLYEETNIWILSSMLIVPVVIAVIFYMRFYQFISHKLLQIFLSVLLVALVCIPTNMIIYDRYIQVFKPVFALTLMATCYNPLIVSKIKVLLLKKIVLIVSVLYAMYYVYTFFIIYKDSFRGFVSLGKLLLVSILDSTYSHRDFY